MIPKLTVSKAVFKNKFKVNSGEIKINSLSSGYKDVSS